MASHATKFEAVAAGAIAHIAVKTTRRTELIQISEQVRELVEQSGVESGVCYVYVPHTTAGVIINEGYDPDVARDMEIAFDKLVPHRGDYRHAEGNSDSHIKVALTSSSQSIFIEGGKLALGRWQQIFFFEFDGPRRREVQVKIIGDHRGTSQT
jgi:secondary thiamine-phosphate synthase enzyme